MVSIGQTIDPVLRSDLATAFADTLFGTTLKVPDVSGRFLIGSDFAKPIGVLTGLVEETLSIK